MALRWLVLVGRLHMFHTLESGVGFALNSTSVDLWKPEDSSY